MQMAGYTQSVIIPWMADTDHENLLDLVDAFNLQLLEFRRLPPN